MNLEKNLVALKLYSISWRRISWPETLYFITLVDALLVEKSSELCFFSLQIYEDSIKLQVILSIVLLLIPFLLARVGCTRYFNEQKKDAGWIWKNIEDLSCFELYAR